MAGNKGKGGKASGSNDQRGGIAKAQEAARKGGQDTASSGSGGSDSKSGGSAKGGKSGGKS